MQQTVSKKILTSLGFGALAIIDFMLTFGMNSYVCNDGIMGGGYGKFGCEILVPALLLVNLITLALALGFSWASSARDRKVLRTLLLLALILAPLSLIFFID